ncbi:MAG: hypothetical protein H8F28_14930, partial [Fibrella sp.]|nr:hypothetical protein [Armatimonadota bacterium]
MSRTTFCDPPDGWNERILNLAGQGLPRTTARTLLAVELCFRLVEFLDRTDEAVGVIPALLSGIPLHGVEWSDEQRRAIANVRQIAPYGSTSAWRNALEAYANIPEEWRHYQFPDQPVPQAESEDDDLPESRIGRTGWLVCVLARSDGERRHP